MFKIIIAVCLSTFLREVKQTKVENAQREESARLALVSIIWFKDQVCRAIIFWYSLTRLIEFTNQIAFGLQLLFL